VGAGLGYRNPDGMPENCHEAGFGTLITYIIHSAVINVKGDGALRRESGDSVSDSDESICRIRMPEPERRGRTRTKCPKQNGVPEPEAKRKRGLSL
jgi:hypothetical protein